MRSFALMAALGLLASAPAHAANEPRALEPNGPWTLHYEDERCSLVRAFGTGDDALRLQIDSYGSYSSFRVLVLGKRVPRSYGPIGEIRFGFPVEQEKRDRVGALHGTADGLPSMSFPLAFLPYEPKPDLRGLSEAEIWEQSGAPEHPVPEFEAQVRSLMLEFTPRNRAELKLGGIAAPLAAMRECLDNLIETWGIDPAQDKTLTRRPVPDLSSVRRLQRAYPPRMLQNGMSAVVPVRIMVDAAGQGSQCVVQLPYVESAFKEAVCDRLAERYSPALDKDGQPVASFFRTTVIYQISS